MSGYCVVQSCRTGWTHFSPFCVLAPLPVLPIQTLAHSPQIAHSCLPTLKDELTPKAERRSPLSQGQQQSWGFLLPLPGPHLSSEPLLNSGCDPGADSAFILSLCFNWFLLVKHLDLTLLLPLVSLFQSASLIWPSLFFLQCGPGSQILPRLWPRVSWYFPGPSPVLSPLGPCIHSLYFPPLLQGTQRPPTPPPRLPWLTCTSWWQWRYLLPSGMQMLCHFI